MRILLVSTVLLLLAACQNTTAPSGQTVETNLSPVQSITLEEAMQRGDEIFGKDFYSAAATDFLLDKGLLNSQSGVLGWITEFKNDTPTTYFLGKKNDQYYVVFEVVFNDDDVKLVPSSAISNELSQKFTVRQDALSAIKSPCSRNYNTVVLERGDKFIVYALATTQQQEAIVAGGHYRFTYNKTDNSQVSKERLSKSCMVLSKADGAVPFTTHILTDGPLEVHAYLGKLHGLFYVSTKNGLFKAYDGKLERLKE